MCPLQSVRVQVGEKEASMCFGIYSDSEICGSWLVNVGGVSVFERGGVRKKKHVRRGVECLWRKLRVCINNSSFRIYGCEYHRYLSNKCYTVTGLLHEVM